MTCGPTANTQDLTSTTNLLTTSSAFSLSFCAKLTSLTGGSCYFVILKTSGGATASWVKIYVTSGGVPTLEYTATGSTATIGGGNVGTANWEWFGLTHDGAGTCRVYRSSNGGAVALQLTQAVNWSGSAPDRMYIFNDEGNAMRTRGQVYGYKEWQAQLTIEELTHECFKIYPTRGTNLNRFIPALNNASVGQDYSGLGHSLTREGAAFTDSTLVPGSQWGGPQSMLSF